MAKKSKIKSILNRIRAEMIAYYRGYYTNNTKKIHDAHWKKINVVEKRLMTLQIYKNINTKQMAADRGMYFVKVNYTQKEEKFMKTNTDYLKMINLFSSMSKKEKIEQNMFLRRMLTNKITLSDEQKIIKNAEISVRERDGQLGLSMDSEFYDLGHRKEYFESRLDYLLAKIGCIIEPWDGSWWTVSIEHDKPTSLAGFKEKYIRERPYESKNLKGLR